MNRASWIGFHSQSLLDLSRVVIPKLAEWHKIRALGHQSPSFWFPPRSRPPYLASLQLGIQDKAAQPWRTAASQPRVEEPPSTEERRALQEQNSSHRWRRVWLYWGAEFREGLHVWHGSNAGKGGRTEIRRMACMQREVNCWKTGEARLRTNCHRGNLHGC